MPELQFSVTYDGRLAAKHRIDMRKYGHALVGLDRMISTGIVGLTERRIPKPRERYQLAITVSEPQHGCVAAAGAVIAGYQGAQQVLPFLVEQVAEHGLDIIWTWLAASFKVLGGRAKDAEPHIQALIKFMDDIDKRHLEDRQREREAGYADRQREREFILQLIDSQRSAAREVVGPVGTSASAVYFGREFDERATEVDEAMAASVRSKADMQVGDLEEVEIAFDGYRRSQGSVWVRRVGIDEDWIKADVRDPAFDEVPNAYSRAAGAGMTLKVLAKPTYKDGKVFKLFIMDAPGGRDDLAERRSREG